MDVREPRFTSDFPAMYRSLRKRQDPAPMLIFLEAEPRRAGAALLGDAAAASARRRIGR